MDRITLSNKYCKGQGLELGPLCFPWPLKQGQKVLYLDLFPTECLRNQYPEHKSQTFCEVSIIDDGTVCARVQTESQDFLLSSHVLEHSENAINSIRNWLRVVKQGGYVLMAVPELTKTFDHKRPVTTWQHFIDEYVYDNHAEHNRLAHYQEYFSLVDNLSGAVLESTVATAMQNAPHIHFHTWNWASMVEFIAKLGELGGFVTHELHFQDHEMFIVLQKTCIGDPNWMEGN